MKSDWRKAEELHGAFPGLDGKRGEESKRLKALLREKAEEGGEINFKGEKYSIGR